MGIKEMFRDCKSGGYNLEGTGLRGNPLKSMILVMSLAYLGLAESVVQVNTVWICRPKNVVRVQEKQVK